MANRNQKKVVFFINVDWYFNLHWVNRARKALENGYQVHVVTNFISKKIKSQLTGIHRVSLIFINLQKKLYAFNFLTGLTG